MVIVSIIFLPCSYAIPEDSAVMLRSVNLENNILSLMEDKEINLNKLVKVLDDNRESSWE
jgi:hypothetical protein